MEGAEKEILDGGFCRERIVFMISRYLSPVLLVACALLGCRKPAPVKDTGSKPAVAEVQVQKIEPRVWRRTVRTFGVLEAAEKVTVSAEITGKVNEVLFDEGSKIESGQKLLSFDVAESRMRLKQAEGNLLGIAARLQEARAMLTRREELFKQRAVSKEQLDAARASTATLEAQYGQLTAGRNLAKYNIRRTQLQSPVSGTVVSKNVEPGEVAMPGEPLAVIHVTDTMRVITWVTQEEVNTVRTGIECSVTTNGVRGRIWKAHVESVGNEADSVTGNFPVKLTVNNSDGLLKAGMSSMVTLTGLEMTDAVLIPDSAVVDRNRKRAVYVVENDKAREVEPVLSASADDSVRHVLHGLSKGDLVIVGGLDHVADGGPVKITDTIPFESPFLPAAEKIDGEMESRSEQPREAESKNKTDSAERHTGAK